MEINNLKNKIQKNVKEKIAISAIREEISMNKEKNKKILYGVLSSCAMFIICGVVIINSNIFNQDTPYAGLEDLQSDKEEASRNEIIDNNEISLPIKDEDANVKEMPNTNSNTEYPDYYAGKYVDSNGNNVILLCEDNKTNRKEICDILEITESKTIFKSAKYSYNYLEELQAKISKGMTNKELTFVISSALRDDTNNIVVTVISNNETDLEKVKKLDTKGGAIEIKFSENNATHELLEKK